MCSRMLLWVWNEENKIPDFVEICNKSAAAEDCIFLKDRHEVSPNDPAPVIFTQQNQICGAIMRWGFSVKDGHLIINSRSEDAAKKPLFSELVNYGRCAVPVSGYFEWRKADHQKYLVTSNTEQGFYLAGLYRIDEKGKYRFVVLTREAYSTHSKVHHRMPVVIASSKMMREWISGARSLDEISSMEQDTLVIAAQGTEQLCMEWDEL